MHAPNWCHISWFTVFYSKVKFGRLYICMRKSVKSYLIGNNLHQMTKLTLNLYLSLVVRKPFFCICENKDADQLRGNREADQRLCFRYTDSTIPLLNKFEISSL